MSDSDPGSPTDPAPSELGTREYWERFYGRELANWEAGGEGEDQGDDEARGEIWFGLQAERRIVDHVERLAADGDLAPGALVVDVGCGNGHLAMRLAAGPAALRLLCLDYSAPAVELTRRLAEQAGLSDRVTARLLDVTEPGAAAEAAASLIGGDLVLIDKGTYDAVSLCADNSPGKRAAYRRFAADLMSAAAAGRSRLVLASCNWTEAELLAQFGQSGFAHAATLPGRPFRFGGIVGADVTTVVLTLTNCPAVGGGTLL